MVIFLYSLYIFGIHLKTVLYPKLCYNEQCYKEVVVYVAISDQSRKHIRYMYHVGPFSMLVYLLPQFLMYL